MLDCCNAQKKADENASKIASAIENHKPPFIAQLNMQNGTQMLPGNMVESLEDIGGNAE